MPLYNAGGAGTPGLPGEDGADGYTPIKGIDYFDGAAGSDGAPGTPGEPGAKGDAGDQGIPGIPGENGADGAAGADGAQGIQGIQGIQGEQGPAGESADPWTFVKLSGDFTTSNATNTNVTGLLFTPAASTTYLIMGKFLLRTATATVGARPGVAWPTNLTDATARMEASASLTTSILRSWGARTTQNAASTGLATTADSHYGALDAMIVTASNVSGDFQITLASETALTNVTMKAGSFIAYRTI
jgi:hypothetical protein